MSHRMEHRKDIRAKQARYRGFMKKVLKLHRKIIRGNRRGTISNKNNTHTKNEKSLRLAINKAKRNYWRNRYRTATQRFWLSEPKREITMSQLQEVTR